MKKRERAAVVELLRCAADVARSGVDVGNAIMNASDYKATGWSVCLDAESAVCGHAPRVYHRRYLWLLEAAQRVEEGSWP